MTVHRFDKVDFDHLAGRLHLRFLRWHNSFDLTVRSQPIIAFLSRRFKCGGDAREEFAVRVAIIVLYGLFGFTPKSTKCKSLVFLRAWCVASCATVQIHTHCSVLQLLCSFECFAGVIHPAGNPMHGFCGGVFFQKEGRERSGA